MNAITNAERDAATTASPCACGYGLDKNHTGPRPKPAKSRWRYVRQVAVLHARTVSRFNGRMKPTPTIHCAITINGHEYVLDWSAARSIAISLQFEGAQPNLFGAPPATRRPLRSGSFVGRTVQGGSCNADEITLVPHCNGTHTESISHIVDDPISVAQIVTEVLIPAAVVSITPRRWSECRETYQSQPHDRDLLITAAALEDALAAVGYTPDAVVVRTLPNDAAKLARIYEPSTVPCYFSTEAIEWINVRGIRHLIVDLPSIDPVFEDGSLSNHHLFWNVPSKTHRLQANSWIEKTITELVFVPDDIADGLYVVNLQLPAFTADAAPSRPVLIPIRH